MMDSSSPLRSPQTRLVQTLSWVCPSQTSSLLSAERIPLVVFSKRPHNGRWLALFQPGCEKQIALVNAQGEKGFAYPQFSLVIEGEK